MDKHAPKRLTAEQTFHAAPVIVARGSREDLLVDSLVLSAVGIDHLLDETNGALLVQPDDAERASGHIRAYIEENKNWPPPPNYERSFTNTDEPPSLLLFGCMAIFFWITGPWQHDNPWFQIGAVDSSAIIEQSQWWRLITALTLHADQMHLIGNCIIGGFMVHLLCKITGYGLGWLLLVLAGAMGNFTNIALREIEHHSVGFSTSIFAAIGMFSGLQIAANRSSLFRQLVIPLGAGAGLLAFLGVEGERTDLGAHFFGFACGIIFGALTRWTGLLKVSGNHRLQSAFLLTALIIVGICWLLAWNAEAFPFL